MQHNLRLIIIGFISQLIMHLLIGTFSIYFLGSGDQALNPYIPTYGIISLIWIFVVFKQFSWDEKSGLMIYSFFLLFSLAIFTYFCMN
jgi:hypothetical protein